MKRPIRTLAALVGFIAFAGACSDDSGESQAPGAGPDASAVVVSSDSVAPATAETAADPAATDAPKQAVAQRVVSLSPTATEILFAIGAGELVIAVDANSNFPAEAPVTDLSGFEPNVEAIAAFEPDLVVLSDDMGNVVAGLQALDIAVLQQPAALSLDDTFAQIEQLGAATGFIAQSAELVKNMQTDIDEIVAGAVSTSATPRTYYHELDPTFYSATSTTFIGQIYATFGLVNIADATSKPADDFGYPQLSPEYIVAQDPDLIFLADVKCCEATVASVGARPGWEALRAVTSGGVVELDDDIASRWGPRVVDQYRVVADALAKLPV
jgi:iron complex transport system substrate-binding protein